MITVEIDCPFSIGDWVYVKYTEYDDVTIECPFCHGKGEYDTGIKIKSSLEYKNPTSEQEESVTTWTIECKTCRGSGKITQLTGSHDDYYRAKVVGVYKVYPDWKTCSFDIDRDGVAYIVEGHRIRTEDEYKRLKENGEL